MKHVFRRLSPWVFLIVFIIFTPYAGLAQADVLGPKPPDDPVQSGGTGAFGDDGDPGDGGCDPLDPACPIDGGLSALLVLGAGYGIKKVRQTRKTVDIK